MRGYAVVDIETTGFSYKHGHRIVEIGVVELSPEGAVQDSWETLINPQRHIAATEIHGISASDVLGAPTFAQVADKLANSLEDRKFVAHNAGFDRTFIQSELLACRACSEEALPAIDTAVLARRYLGLPKVKLGDCCAHLGIHNELAHSALADAMATAQLFQHFLANTPAAQENDMSERLAEQQLYRSLAPHPGWVEPALLSRAAAESAKQAAQYGGWFAGLVAQRETPSNTAAEDYFKLLDAALLDRRLSATEQTQLLAFAQAHGLDEDGLRELHEAYITLLIEEAWADGVVTAEERDILASVGRALGIPASDIEAAVDPDTAPQAEGRHGAPSEEAPQGSEKAGSIGGLASMGGIVVSAGERVTITGAKAYSTAEWEEYFAAHGVEIGGLAKKTKVLIAGDPDSQSGKAKKAKQYGIPIVAEDVAREVIHFAD